MHADAIDWRIKQKLSFMPTEQTEHFLQNPQNVTGQPATITITRPILEYFSMNFIYIGNGK